MTRRDYVLIAEVLKGLGQDGVHCFDNAQDRKAIALRFSQALSEQNPVFDNRKFISAATTL